MTSSNCRNCGEALSWVFSYDYGMGKHDVYRCANCCSFWSDGWGSDLIQEPREKGEVTRIQDDQRIKGSAATGRCFSDGGFTEHRLSTGLFLCLECTSDWIGRGWLTAEEQLSDLWFEQNSAWTKVIDARGIIQPVEKAP
jgi:hypothetical protein